MRILVVCPNEEFALGNLCKGAFEALGHKTFLFDLKQKGSHNKVLKSRRKCLNESLSETVAEFRPDLLFVTKGIEIFSDTIASIRKLGVITANWFPDDPYSFEESKKIAPSYDFYFTNDSTLIPAYIEAGQKNVHFLPFCCEPKIHRKIELTPDERKKYSAGVSFVGQWNKVRQEMLEKIAGFDLKVYGPGWTKRVRKASPLFGKVYEPVYNTELAKVYSASSIVLNIHLWFGHYTHGVNMRLFEAAGCAALQIADFQEQIPQLFCVDKEILIFNRVDELTNIVRRCIADEKTRLQIGVAAQARAYNDHTYEIRMREVLDICCR